MEKRLAPVGGGVRGSAHKIVEMANSAGLISENLLGREPERLTIAERRLMAGQWIALEVYTPDTLPLRRIEAVGGSVAACMAQLAQRGLDPRKFEFSVLRSDV